MNIGDTLVYGDGSKAKIVGLPKINGEPGIQLDGKGALFASDVFKRRSEIEKWVNLGVWKIIPKRGRKTNAED